MSSNLEDFANQIKEESVSCEKCHKPIMGIDPPTTLHGWCDCGSKSAIELSIRTAGALRDLLAQHFYGCGKPRTWETKLDDRLADAIREMGIMYNEKMV